MGSNPPGYIFSFFSDSRELVIHYRLIRKFKFRNHFIIYQNYPFKGQLCMADYAPKTVPGELRFK